MKCISVEWNCSPKGGGQGIGDCRSLATPLRPACWFSIRICLRKVPDLALIGRSHTQVPSSPFSTRSACACVSGSGSMFRLQCILRHVTDLVYAHPVFIGECGFSVRVFPRACGGFLPRLRRGLDRERARFCLAFRCYLKVISRLSQCYLRRFWLGFS